MKKNYMRAANRWFLIGSVLLTSGSVIAQSTLKFQLMEPTYLCQSGFIGFNTFGGDGSPITYSATGVTLSSPSSNTGVVDQARRTNPNAGPVIIQATQSDTTVSYTFSVPTYCPPSNYFLLPILKSPIPDTTLIVGDANQSLNVGNYFKSNNIGYDYRASFGYQAYGIPPGMVFRSGSGRPPGTVGGDTAFAFIGGAPTALGDYTVAVIATSKGAFTEAYSIADTFKIRVRSTRPPTGKPLALVQPAYDCLNGIITFKTTGGDGTTIEFMATGITDWNTNPRQVVSTESRLASTLPPFTLMARQSGQVVTYTWDLDAACASTPLVLRATYHCSSGIVSFIPSAGNGSPITYTAPDVDLASPATNYYNVIKKELLDNPRPITIQASQRGTTASYTFDFIDPCRFRLNGPMSDANYTHYTGNSFYYNVSNYFYGPLQGYPFEESQLRYEVKGLPTGLSLASGPPDSQHGSGTAYITGTSTITGVYTVTVVATNHKALGSPSTTATFKITIYPSTEIPLALALPNYDCQTGAFRFNTYGGDNTLIEYYAAPGITGWTTNPDQLVDVETRTAPDAQPITLRARQNNKEVFYVWDIHTVCPIGNPDALRLNAPDYDCGSGAFTFRTTGGNGSLVEFMAIGITGWSTNPDQFVDTETRTAADAPPITLKARQSGQEITYEWNIRAVCPLGSFRVGVATEPTVDLQLNVLGNPVIDETVEVEIIGTLDQSLRLQTFNEQGHQVSEAVIKKAASHQRSTLRLGSSPGIYLIRVSTPTQRQTVKVIK